MEKKQKPSHHAECFATANYREVQQRRYLADFGQWHYEWLREIGRQWKERGEYALDRFSLMDYYDDAGDIETAGYVSLLTCDNWRLHDQIAELRNIIGPHPWQMVKKRAFIVFAQPTQMNQRIIGTNHRLGDLYNVLDWFWHNKLAERGADYSVSDVVKIQDYTYMANMLAVRMAKTDGIGKGLYPDDTELSCPISKDMLQLIRAFYPLGGLPGSKKPDANTADDVLAFMGYDDTTEFIYTYQGYRQMEAVMPEAMRRNEKIFLQRFRNGFALDTHRHGILYMKEIIPEIRFE